MCFVTFSTWEENYSNVTPEGSKSSVRLAKAENSFPLILKGEHGNTQSCQAARLC